MKAAQRQIAEFGWRVAEAGYEWKQSVGSKQHLYERNIPGKGSRIYRPLVDTPGCSLNLRSCEVKTIFASLRISTAPYSTSTPMTIT